MPRRLLRYLSSHSLAVHFRRALLLGLFARLLSAWFVYGPQALDDYKHGVWPAYQFFAGLPLDLPDYRSHLLIWFLGGFVKIASWFGVESALGQVRAMYIGLGVTSLTAVVGTYLYARVWPGRVFGALALYLMALFPLMPFVSTRAFGEAVAMSLVVFSFGLLEFARRRRENDVPLWTFGFLMLGIATLFRFHVGLLYFSYGGVLLFTRQWRAVSGALIAGLVTLALEFGIDWASGKGVFGTLVAYLEANEGGAAKYGVSPWYNPTLFILAVSLAPFSFVLMRSAKGLWRRHRWVIFPALVFLVAHSVVPHKEERFLYPILGLELWFVAYLWAANARRKLARRVYAPAVFVISALALPIVCFVNTQEGEIEPPALAESRYGSVVYLDYESLFGKSRFQFYFLRPPSKLESVTPMDFNAHRVDATLAENTEAKAVVMLTSDPDTRAQLEALAGIRTLEGNCLEVEASGSIVDRLIYSMNPKHNQRRRPTWYLVCERSGARA